ncbi:MAG TPA: hypothetical protein VI756_09420 [Blastocatellia bacterium]
MYLLGRLRGWSGQEQLWHLWLSSAVAIYSLTEDETGRMSVLMEKYKDVPMDLADASLIVIAESTGSRQVFILDSDFFVYRVFDKDPLEIIPAIANGA